MVMLVEKPVKYLTPQEVAEELRVTPRTVHRLIETGELPALRVGRQYRIPREAFETYQRRVQQGTDT